MQTRRVMSTVSNADTSCERCGRCLSVCPVYDMERIETLSPRGRLDLIAGVQSGQFVPGPRYTEALFSCLQCLACVEACPKGVDAAARILQGRMRSTSVTPNGMRLERFLLDAVLDHRPLAAALVRLASEVQRLLPESEPSCYRHLPMFFPDMLAGRRIPDVGRIGLYRGLPEVIPADPDTDFRGQVMLFTGCYFGLVETEPLLAAIRVLSFNGWEVHIPADQSCCGAVALSAGHADVARRMAVRNLEALAGGGHPVVTACATCGRTLKREYLARYTCEGTAAQRQEALELAERTWDIHEWLDRNGPLRQGRPTRRRRVTIHDPCHLARGQGIRGEVRRLLDAVSDVERVEMVDAEACCGGGGLSGMKHPAVSLAVGARKIAAIEATGADTVVAGCPGCLIQIRDLLSRKRSGIQALHPMEVLAGSCRPKEIRREQKDGLHRL